MGWIMTDWGVIIKKSTSWPDPFPLSDCKKKVFFACQAGIG